MSNLAYHILRRGKAWLKRRLGLSTPLRDSQIIPYQQWMQDRIQARISDFPPVSQKRLFSILTPVFDPAPKFLQELTASIFAQDHTDWQWVLVDNGCRNPIIRQLLEQISRDDRVTLIQAEKPLGIMGGMRLALEHAGGQYVCPVDHDDWLYPDALRVVAASLQATNWPDLVYTDEDKLLPDGSRDYPFLKPDWDPLLFLNCCFVAHLGVMNRRRALELGVYSDPRAEGTPDGDAFCRFLAAGITPLHIPEVVYSWRMHDDSTALRGIEAKLYVIDGQRHALNQFLQKSGLANQITLRTNPLPGIPGIWRVAPHPIHSSPRLTLLLKPGGTTENRQHILDRLSLCSDIKAIESLDSTPTALRDALTQSNDSDWVIILDPHYIPLTTDFVSEFHCVQQAIATAVMIGGTVLTQDNRVESAGLAWGFDGLLGSPLNGSQAGDIHTGAGAMTLQRCVTGVDHRFFFVQVGFLRQVLANHLLDADHPLLAAYLAAYAHEHKKRILFSPYLRCQQIDPPMPRQSSTLEEFTFLSRFSHLLTRDRYYPRYYGLQPNQAFQLVSPADRARSINRWIGNLAGTDANWRDQWLPSNTSISPLIQYQQEFTSNEISSNQFRKRAG